MSTLRTPETVTIIIPVGNALTVTAPTGSTATVNDQTDFSPSGTVTGTTTMFGPYTETTTVAVVCTAGAVSWDVSTPVVQNYTTAGLVLPRASGIGIKVDTITPTFGWRDMLGSIKTRTGGATIPSFSAYRGGLYSFAFDSANAVQEVFNEFHILHDYVPASDLYIHTHWSTAVTATGVCNWIFELDYAKGYDQGVFEGTAGSAGNVTIPVVSATGSTAYMHRISEVQCSIPGGLVTSAINVSITASAATLTAASALFTAADIGRTVRIAGAGAAGAAHDTTITAFGSTTSVTVANNAVTTVTAKPAFSYRILDSNLIETDGVILARIWRDASRAADTLNQTPFLHFVDMHYQSTNISTKQRNGPDFWAA